MEVFCVRVYAALMKKDLFGEPVKKKGARKGQEKELILNPAFCPCRFLRAVQRGGKIERRETVSTEARHGLCVVREQERHEQ